MNPGAPGEYDFKKQACPFDKPLRGKLLGFRPEHILTFLHKYVILLICKAMDGTVFFC